MLLFSDHNNDFNTKLEGTVLFVCVASLVIFLLYQNPRGSPSTGELHKNWYLIYTYLVIEFAPAIWRQ